MYAKYMISLALLKQKTKLHQQHFFLSHLNFTSFEHLGKTVEKFTFVYDIKHISYWLRITIRSNKINPPMPCSFPFFLSFKLNFYEKDLINALNILLMLLLTVFKSRDLGYKFE